MLVELKRLYGDLALPPASLESLQTGDILLYQTTDLGAAFNRCVTMSFWSHVGLVVRVPPQQREALEALYPPDYIGWSNSLESLAVLEAVPRRGVCLFPLEPRLARTVSSVRHLAVRSVRASSSLSAQQGAQLGRFIAEVINRPLETASVDMVRAVCLRALGRRPEDRHEEWSKFFCSELVAEGLQQAGILSEKVNSNDFLPASFATTARDAGFPCLDSCLAEGIAYERERVLIEPGNALEAELKTRKQALKRQQVHRERAHIGAIRAVGILLHRARSSRNALMSGREPAAPSKVQPDP